MIFYSCEFHVSVSAVWIEGGNLKVVNKYKGSEVDVDGVLEKYLEVL